MTFFGNPTQAKYFRIDITTIWNSSSLLVKINLDSTIRQKGLDKINVRRVYNLHFFKTIGPHVCDS
jgi:hypothetical protein